MSGLLGNLVSQIAQSAMNANQQPAQSQQSQQSQGGMGDLLGGMLSSALGGQQQNQQCNPQAGGLGSVLGSVLSASMGGGGGQQQANPSSNQGMLMAMIMPMVLNWIQSKGGLSGALSQIQNLGLTEQVSSWMSVDQPNVNLDENQVNQLFGEEPINQVASQAGVEKGLVAQGIGALLPEVINQLTPKGGTEYENEANSEISDILGQLGGLL